MKNPIATFFMENGKKIVIELSPEEAPNTVNSFIFLAQRGCYDNHAIERIVPGYVVDFSYSAFHREECKYLIANESLSHGFPNHMKMAPGVIAMGGYDNGIAGGEIFFPLAVSEKLTGNYPAFGKVLEGMEEIRRWENADLVPVPFPVPGIEVNEPKTPIIVERVTVETFGEIYPEPIKLTGERLPENWR